MGKSQSYEWILVKFEEFVDCEPKRELFKFWKDMVRVVG